MPDKYILIKKSELTRKLKSLSNSTVEMVALRVPTIKVAQAMTELNTINEDNWISSDNQTERAGDITNSIILPKEAINA
ncbi:MAG: hypothetical protein NZ735_00840 [Candidatus Marinimicrobia bacterium]|nr:hypothetical protein [Candidatus Neomarinimicrobiota bacterium]